MSERVTQLTPDIWVTPEVADVRTRELVGNTLQACAEHLLVAQLSEQSKIAEYNFALAVQAYCLAFDVQAPYATVMAVMGTGQSEQLWAAYPNMLLWNKNDWPETVMNIVRSVRYANGLVPKRPHSAADYLVLLEDVQSQRANYLW